MRFLKRFLPLGGRGGAAEGEDPRSSPLPAPDWVFRDTEEGFVKVRLFLSPAGTTPSLYEIDLPEDDRISPGTLRCFSPPPDSGGAGPDPSRRAWTVQVSDEEVAELRGLAQGISLFPMGGAMPSEEAATVELSLAAGQAEARIRWWMSPPERWTGVDRFVARLRELAEE